MDTKLLVHQLTSHRQKKFFFLGILRLSSSLIDCNIGVIGVLFFVIQSYLLVQIISASMGQSPAPRVSLDWTIRVLLQCCYLKLLLSYLSVSYVLKCFCKKILCKGSDNKKILGTRLRGFNTSPPQVLATVKNWALYTIF